MSKSTSPALVPKLRFPEFRDARPWEENTLNNLAQPILNKATEVEDNEVLTLSAEHGIVLQNEYFGKKIAGENVSRYIKIEQHDFVYNDRTTKLFTYGTIKRLSQYKNGIVSPIYKCFRFREQENPIFWEWYFNAGSHESQLHSLINEGARAGRFNISIEKFLSISVWHPSLAEQEKIAACLGSLDELIGAEQEKLAALRQHKQGLMQQLFPAAGETTPRLRFPEFQGERPWEEKSLQDIATITSGGTPNRSEPRYWGGNIPWVTTSLIDFNRIDRVDEFITTEGLNNSSAKLFPAQTLLMAMYGQGKTRGKVALLGIEATTNQACAAIIFGNEIDTNFAFQNLASRYNEIRKLSNEGGQENLSAGLIKQITLIYPSLAEQQKIADCLSALDEQINQQAQKIEALQQHKKGLMQQLFPTTH